MLFALRSKFFVSLFSLICLSWNANAKTYVFVSHAMPDHALQAYHAQAQKEGATLVMRGLKDDSFVATQGEAKRLGIIYDIHPELFDEYDVTRVPTFVMTLYDKTTEPSPFKISGHISLKTALELIRGPQEREKNG